jgi:hypothetical protein
VNHSSDEVSIFLAIATSGLQEHCKPLVAQRRYMMAKAKQKSLAAVETNGSAKSKILRERLDVKHFRKGLKADLIEAPNKAITDCASIDPNLIDKVLRAHFNESSDYAAQRLQTNRAPKREHDSKRAITQAEATAYYKKV